MNNAEVVEIVKTICVTGGKVAGMYLLRDRRRIPDGRVYLI